jgi:3-deoxy-manno-octulosonate cytidylyltransferase (CMP-KDO synthetase)
MCPLLPGEDPGNINIPKVVVNRYNDLVYMSRLAVPGVKSPGQQPPLYLKQVCIYAFTAQELAAFGEQRTKAVFEAFEDIEILRFLDMGMPVKMVMTSGNTLAVDVPEDVAKVEAALQQLN